MSLTGDSPPEAQRRRLGAAAGLAVAGAYAALELTGVADGLLLYVPLIAALVIARALEGSPRGRRAGRLVALVVAGGCFPLAILVWRFRLDLADVPFSLLAVVLAVAGGMSAACLSRSAREWLLRPLRLHPESAVHTVCAIAFALALLLSAGDFVALQSGPDGATPIYPTDPFTSLLSDTTLAMAGVGLMQTRNLRATIARLDLKPVGARQLAWAVLAAACLLAGIGLMERAESVLFPAVYALENRFEYEFVNIPPFVGAILVSVSAGAGEEILFRGAIQPRFGVVLTALIFAATHTQYQVPGLIMIFLMGLALGVMKQRTSTTFAAGVHVLYDIGAFLLPDL